jgi:predicted signal transduction protein with EAL and GGDEF domain
VETKRLSNENFRLGNVDSLADLPNRRQFFHGLSVLAEQARMVNHRFVVGVLDLDGFKAVNDRYGHGVGHRVLMKTGQRLLALSDDTQFIARLGGDEFGIIACRVIREWPLWPGELPAAPLCLMQWSRTATSSQQTVADRAVVAMSPRCHP